MVKIKPTNPETAGTDGVEDDHLGRHGLSKKHGSFSNQNL